MKKRFLITNNKKILILVSVVLLLIASTIAGVVIFLKDDGEARAATDPSVVSQTGGEVNLPPDDIQEETSTLPQTGDSNLTELIDQDDEQDTNIGTSVPEQGETLDTTDTTQLPEETVTIVERLESESLTVGWTPIGLSAIASTTHRNLYIPELDFIKTSYTQTDLINFGINIEELNLETLVLPEQTTTTDVKSGEIIIYEIIIINYGTLDAKDIRIIDTIPEGTTLVDNSITNGGKYTNNAINWFVNISSEETIKVRFAVKVNEETEKTIINTAIVNGIQTQTTENPVVTEIKAEKVWEDNNNSASTRPESIKLQLKAGTNIVDEQIVKGDSLSDQDWNYTFIAPKYNNLGEEIIYTVDESEVNQGDLSTYNKSINENTITNTKKDTSVKVHHYIEGTTTSLSEDVIINGKVDDDYTTSVATDIPSKYKLVETPTNATGKMTEEQIEVIYYYELKDTSVKVHHYIEGTTTSLSEDVIINGKVDDDYTTTVGINIPLDYELVEVPVNSTGKMTEAQIIVTYYYKLATINKQVVKIWEDNNNINYKRPALIELQVKKGANTVASQRVSINNDWSYTFTDLPKYEPGTETEIIYTVDESEVNQGDLKFYAKSINGDTITNTFKVPNDTKEITVTKIWNDNNDQANKRPNNITLQVKQADKVVKEQVITSAEDWKYVFEVPKYNENVDEIRYTVDEKEIPQFYDKTINSHTITNTFTVPEDTKKITVTKVWDDNNNQKGKRPETILLLLKGNNEIYSQTVSVANSWKHTFEVPVYDNNANKISYIADEAEANENDLEFYLKTVNNNTITNTYVGPEIVVTKQSDKQGKVVEYSDTIKYTITATNSGYKSGNVKITDTMLLEAINNNNLTLKGNITVTGWSNNPTPTELANGITVTVPAKVGETAGEIKIEFTVTVTANAGEVVENQATVEDAENTETDKIITNVEKTIKQTDNTETIKGKNIVLVLDTSGSMDDKEENDDGWLIKRCEDPNCTRTHSQRWSIFIGTYKCHTKLTTAIDASYKFINNIYPAGTTNNTPIAVIEFNTNASRVGNIATNYTQAQQLKTSIGNLKATGNTAMGKALTLANTVLSDISNQENYKNNDNVVVFLSDGAPTDGNAYVTPANTLKNKNGTNATVYTIGFEVSNDQNAQTVLKNIATDSNHAYLSNMNDLFETFESITSSIIDSESTVQSINGKVILSDTIYANQQHPVTITINNVSTKYYTISNDKIILENGKYYLDLTKFKPQDKIEIEYFSK